MINSEHNGAPEPELVLFFDGVCNLCHGTVRFVIRHDPEARFRFTSLQSTPGKRIAERHGVNGGTLQSMLLLEDGRLHSKSTAALRIARRLRWPWPLAYALIVIPRPVRDGVYDFIGRRRYRWFGKRDYCVISQPGEERRFLVDEETR